MAARNFLILHGLEGSGPGHWQTWLAARLRADGERVAYPDLPDADMPSLHSWREPLEGELDALPEGETIVVCHSLACLLWLHHVADGGEQADRACCSPHRRRRAPTSRRSPGSSRSRCPR